MEEFIAAPIVLARDAIASHVRWKITLLMAIQMREPLSARANRSILHPEECSAGQWLVSRHTLHLRRAPEYLALVALHQAFHIEMLKVANLIDAGNFAAADRLINHDGSFQRVSNAVPDAIMALDRIHTGKLAP